jgi:PAS domain S-box-containing protein
MAENYKILLIEDDEVDQMVFKRMVKKEQLGYDLQVASSVSEARELIAERENDTIIVDYNLGDGTAFDILEVISDTPVIFATGAGNEEIAIKAMRAGAYDYLIKDINRSYLEVLPLVIDKAIKHNETEKQLANYHQQLEITVKKRTEELEEQKERLSVTFESISDAIVAVGNNKLVSIFNKKAEQLTGVVMSDAVGKPFGSVLHFIDELNNKRINNPIDEAFEEGKTVKSTGSPMILKSTGEKTPVSFSAAPITKTEGDIIGVVLIIRNVSHEREVERMKTDFISSVSHELRTPLTSIKALNAAMLRDKEMPEETREQFLNVIEEDTVRLGGLIEELLEVARIEAGTMKLDIDNVDVKEVVEEVRTCIAPLAGEKQIELVTEIAETVPVINADRSRIVSVFTNLVNNAVKFTPEAGRVEVLVTATFDGVQIEVKDTGIGIPESAIDKIFDRFYRVDRPGTEIQGTGIGLAIVHKIVELHNGMIKVESEPGNGSKFTVTLPLDGTEQKAEAEKQSTNNPTDRTQTNQA